MFIKVCLSGKLQRDFHESQDSGYLFTEEWDNFWEGPEVDFCSSGEILLFELFGGHSGSCFLCYISF